MVTDTNNKKSTFKINFLIFFFSVIISVLILELVARQLMPAPLPWLYPQIRYQSNKDLIFSLKPNDGAFTADKPALINKRGLRGPIYNYEKRIGVTRIMFLGDSVVFGFGVDESDIVTSKVEQLMNSQGKNVEVINTGVPSYNTEQEVAYFETQGFRYSPDWVILGFYWNDVSDKSDVKVSKDGWLIERDVNEGQVSALKKFWITERGYSIRNLIKRSRLIYGLMQGYKIFNSRGSVNLNSNLRTDILNGKETGYLTDRWGEIEKAMKKFGKLAEAYSFKPVIVVFPIPPTLAESYPKSKFVDTVRGIAKRSNIPLVDLEPEFRAAYKGHESLFIPYDSDHPNAAGHAVAAKAISRFLINSFD